MKLNARICEVLNLIHDDNVLDVKEIMRNDARFNLQGKGYTSDDACYSYVSLNSTLQ